MRIGVAATDARGLFRLVECNLNQRETIVAIVILWHKEHQSTLAELISQQSESLFRQTYTGIML